MELAFRAIDCPTPDEQIAALFEERWPSYREWFLSRGNRERPSYPRCRAALREHMPELVPTYERLVDVVGGGDLAARFLSLYCPPRYFAACSQAAWTASPAEAVLIRNYDYVPDLCDGVVLRSRWGGQGVIAMTDCLWGALDGMNESGLAISLAFGGRPGVGEGFGIPLVLRYILEVCRTSDEAAAVLRRVPVHMSYNVTFLDAKREFLTAYVAPDREPVLRRWPTATNHQGTVEWPAYAAATGTVEREQFLAARLADPFETGERLLERFLEPPLFLPSEVDDSSRHGWVTLYTAAYRVATGTVDYRWREGSWRKSFTEFAPEELRVRY